MTEKATGLCVTLVIMMSLMCNSCIAAITIDTADPFIQTLTRNWARWSEVSDAGVTTPLQVHGLIDKLGDPGMADSSEDAAALAAVAYYYSLVAPGKLPDGRPDRNPTITLNNIFTIEANGTVVYTPAGQKINELCFLPMSGELKSLKQNQFPLFLNGQPVFTNIHQNAVGDCYLVSAIGWLVHNSPQAIPGMMTAFTNEQASGTVIPYSYYVNLPGWIVNI